jgi:L,D-transpeptidase catalytic domain
MQYSPDRQASSGGLPRRPGEHIGKLLKAPIRSAGHSWGADRPASGRRATVHRLVVALSAIVAVVGCSMPVRQRLAPGEQAIADRVAQYGPAARARLAPFFATAGIAYPPERFVLLGFKRERELHLIASGSGRDLTFIRAYPIQGMSGELGPKLREGDGQVPEGVYTIVYLNPDSVAHLSLALSYPNDYDRARAAEDGRDTLGGDIMIHGGSTSSGCLAMGDEAAEELFVLAADAGWEGAVVVLSPVDFRRNVLPVDYRAQTAWVEDLYVRLRAVLEGFPIAPTEPSWSTPPL